MLFLSFLGSIFQKTHQKQAPTAPGPSLSNAKLKMLYADVLNVTEGARKVCFTTKLLFAKPPRIRRLDAPFVLNRRASRGAPTWGHRPLGFVSLYGASLFALDFGLVG